MAEIRDTSSEGSSPSVKKEHFNVLPVAAVDEPSLYKRKGDKTWDNDSLDSFYKPIDSYEGIHRFDPDFQWDPKEEKKLVRKVCIPYSRCLGGLY